MGISLIKIKSFLSTTLTFVTGFISVVCFGSSIIFYRIDMQIANNTAPFLLFGSIALCLVYIFIVYRSRRAKKHKFKSVLFSVTGILVVSWLFFLVTVFLLQDVLVYQRQHISKERLEWVNNKYNNVKEISIPTGEVKLHGWYVKNIKDKKESPLIIYFGGGAEEISKRIDDFNKIEGWSIALINYRGYGLSVGKPNEENIFKDTLKIYDYFYNSKEVDKDRIVIMGRSLGTGPAVYLAANRKHYKTILVSPYDSMTNWLQYNVPFIPAGLVMKSPFDSLSRAPLINTAVLCLVGDKDKSVLPSQSERLISKWGGKSIMHTIKSGTHNTILYSEECWDTVKSFLDS